MNQNLLSLDELRKEIDCSRLPKHIGIIMDGNGRWATNRKLPRNLGHKEGVNRVIDTVEEASQLGIEHLTLYAFSTENWKRPEDEINGLMKLLVYFINKELDRLNKYNIKLKTLGDITKLPQKTYEEVLKAIDKTKNNTGMILNIALNYGGRSEIIDGIKDVLKDVESGNLKIDDLTEDLFSGYLYTKGQPDPDLIIRASGELRISNFLLYQIAYSEFWFSNILWPDFTKERFCEAIIDYQNRNRRFGGL